MRTSAVETAALFELRPLHRQDLPVETKALAKFLIGKILVREDASGVLAGRIVETEA
ncbi:DNA-3-methyladenine glycosylase, partial [Vibrio cholerae]|nr:DNA-3-methyladenine glycosylase [Vibrio cholerae]